MARVDIGSRDSHRPFPRQPAAASTEVLLVEPRSEVVVLLPQLLVELIDEVVGLLLGQPVEKFGCWLVGDALEVDSPGECEDETKLFRRGRILSVIHELSFTRGTDRNIVPTGRCPIWNPSGDTPGSVFDPCPEFPTTFAPTSRCWARLRARRI